MYKEPLSLAHRDLLTPRLQALHFELSEYSFANLYLFRSVHTYEVLFAEGIYISGKTRDGHLFLMPTCRPSHSSCCTEIKKLLQDHEFLYPIPPEGLVWFPPRLFESSHLDADTDYIYKIEKFRTYPGRHLSSRRNLLKQFKEHTPNHRSQSLTTAHTLDALALLDKWQAHAHADKRFTDYEACKDALEKFDMLHLQGRVVYTEKEQMIGFIIGESLTSSTYDFHFAKGDTAYKGIYQFLYNDFALSLEDTFEFINLEQDLGSADLAQSKRAYQPDRLLPKMRIHLKK